MLSGDKSGPVRLGHIAMQKMAKEAAKQKAIDKITASSLQQKLPELRSRSRTMFVGRFRQAVIAYMHINIDLSQKKILR